MRALLGVALDEDLGRLARLLGPIPKSLEPGPGVWGLDP